ncbi:hypothetical protein SLA2020_382450 [Shorea laevis]
MSSPMGAVILPIIQNLETTPRAGAVPQVSQFRPLVAQPPQLVTTTNVKKSDNQVKSEEPKTMGNAVQPTVKLAEQQKYSQIIYFLNHLLHMNTNEDAAMEDAEDEV